MVKAYLLSLSILFVCSICSAQNLIANPGFEDFNNCPQNRGEIIFSPGYTNFPTAAGWVNALFNTSPDYYNKCSNNFDVSLPHNTYNDYQEARGGNACAGIAAFSGLPDAPWESDYREYVETRLSQPLLAGKRYYINFFVNDTYHIPSASNQITIDKIGARITQQPLNVIYPWGYPELNIYGSPDVYNPPGTFLSDTATWNKVSGLYAAQGGEEWLTIGYFKEDEPLDHIKLYQPTPGPNNLHSICYMYIDDVCVTEIETQKHDVIYADGFPVDISAMASGAHIWNTGATSSTLSIPGPGTYWVTTTQDCLYRADTFTVLCNERTATKTDTIITTELPVTLRSSMPKGTYEWSNGSEDRFTLIYTPGTYWVKAYYNCQTWIDTFYILCNRDTAEKDDITYTPSLPIQLTAEPEGDSLRWDNGYTMRIREITYPGIYTVVIWDGCRTYINTTEVIDLAGCLWMPTAFTPNGDGKNDDIGPVDVCKKTLPMYHFSIFNRYGELVFDADNMNDRWDGYHKGQPADIGVYYYMLQYGADGKDGTPRKGDITLIR